MAHRAPDAVVVTGAGRGIGRAVALALGKAGVATLCVSRTATADDTAQAIGDQGGVAEALRVDLADPLAAESAVATWLAANRYERLGAVLAAGELGPTGPLDATDLAAWPHVFAVNVLGNLAVARALLARMVDSAWGRLVFFGGGGAAYAYPTFPAYACTKAAMVRAVENLHEDVATRGDIAAVCLAPGAVETDMLREVRAAGAEVRTTAPVDNAVDFAMGFLGSDHAKRLSGRFVHARDPWQDVLDGSRELPADHWTLRRVE
jgi:NAD(P)-dependent dehydrogenase (short-subunit alcohol dehydrogenase family)